MLHACVAVSPCKAMLLLSACERPHAIRLRNSTRLQAGTRPASLSHFFASTPSVRQAASGNLPSYPAHLFTALECKAIDIAPYSAQAINISTSQH